MFRKLEAPTKVVTIYIDGRPCQAEETESVAAVLARQLDFWSRKTPNQNLKRAPYCMMGVCFECLAVVDGVSSTQTCLATVRDGMCIERQAGRRKVI